MEHPNTLSGDATLSLPEFDSPPADPIALMRDWFDAAVQRGVREPYAAVLATADGAGCVSTRVLLVKEISDRGLVFGSSRDSRKGRDIAENPVGSMSSYWRETLQQVSIDGRIEIADDDESDALFAGRQPGAQAAAIASAQSSPLDGETALRERAAELQSVAESGGIERPSSWVAYVLVPNEIEFWYGSPDRLHRRLRYYRHDDGWISRRLQP